MSFSTYLFFSNGACREAMTRYQQIFGGELELMTNAEVPDPAAGMPGADPSAVIHASLQVGDSTLMASDDPTGDGGPRLGSAVSFGAADADSARTTFDALCEGGEVTMPLTATFFSTGFGMCTDRYGVPWMVVAPPPDA
jgi:PhnB protein